MGNVTNPGFERRPDDESVADRVTLDASQLAVLTLADGDSAAVLGAPGTGKTLALVELVAERVLGRGYSPAEVLVLVPTAGGASSLRDRLALRLGVPTNGSLVRTTVSVAAQLARDAAAHSGGPVPTQLSGAQQDRIIAELLRRHQDAGSGPVWPDPLGADVRGLRGFRTELRELMARAVAYGVSPERLAGLGAETGRPEWCAAAEFIRDYTRERRHARPGEFEPTELADFAADLVRLAPAGPAGAALLGTLAGLRLIVLEDAQEVTQATLTLLARFAARGVAVVAFGDPDISVGSAGGAHPDALGRLGHYLGLDGVRTLTLATVHRHGAAVRAVVDEVTGRIGAAGAGGQRSATLPGPHPSDPRSSTDPRPGAAARLPARVQTIVAAGPAEQLAVIARRLRERHLIGGVPWGRMAVLVRTESLVPALSKALAGLEVPTQPSAGHTALRDEHVVMAFVLALDVTLGRRALDADAAIELLRGPLGGLDPITLRRLRAALHQQELHHQELHQEPRQQEPQREPGLQDRVVAGQRGADELLVGVLTTPGALDEIDNRTARRVGRFGESLRAAAEEHTAGATIEDLLWGLWRRSGLAAIWLEQSGGTGIVADEANHNLDAVVALFAAAKRFLERNPAAPPVRFLEHFVDTEAPEDTLVPRALGDAVAVSGPGGTIGREFDVVVIAGVQENVWPDLRPRGSLLGAADLAAAAGAVRPAGKGCAATLPVATLPAADLRTAVLYDELRLFAQAASRTTGELLVTAIDNEDNQPSSLLRLLPAPDGETAGAYPLSLRGMVGRLRRDLTNDLGPQEQEQSAAAPRALAIAATLARLAREQVAGADPQEWYGVPGQSTPRPLNDPDAGDGPVRVSPSKMSSFETCPLHWLIGQIGGGNTNSAANIGTIIHKVMEDATDISPAALWQGVEERWGELVFEADWQSRLQKLEARKLTDRLASYLRDSERAGTTLLSAEGTFALEVGGALLSGTIDRVERLSDGRAVIVDLKTGKGDPTADAGVTDHSQLGAYQLAFHDGAIAGIEPGTVLAGARLVIVSSGTQKQNYRNPTQEAFTPEQLERSAPGSATTRPGWAARCSRPKSPTTASTRGRSGPAASTSSSRSAHESAPPRHARRPRDRRRAGRCSPPPEQQAVIEAPLSPVLVVAGAGSGKTETMANRVLWLLANGHARPDQILGLTFTRKAARELAERINNRIEQLDTAGLMPNPPRPDEPLTRDSSDLLNTPSVSTYNSFASRLFSDNALLLGREAGSVLLSETSAWLLARRVVIEHGDTRLVSFGKSLDVVTDAVLQLSRVLAENPPPFRPGEPPAPHDLAGLAGGFGYLRDLPYGSARKNKPFDSVVDALAAVAPLPVLAELADRYQDAKRARGLIEFSDQVSLALQVCQKVDRVVARARDQYRVVLLDEYQDTSVLQTELLRTLFAHHPVMAVGDPHQSIYGWRGASSANLLGFSRDFAGVSNSQAPSMSLSYTWRNPVAVLNVANALVSPLSAALRAKPNGIQVDILKVPAGKETGRVEARMAETIAEEAAAIASWFAKRLPEGGTGTGAMLFRARRDMDFFAEVLRERGVKAHVLGLGGLLSTPEVADVVSVLRVVHDPSAGSELVRLLSGGRWRIGPRDLQALAGVARWLAAHDWAHRAMSDELKAGIRASVAGDDASSLVDALDFVSTTREDHGQLAGFSDEGRRRLRDAGGRIAWFRERAGLPLLDFMRLVEQELLLDVELVANEGHGRGLGNLDAFHDNVSGFLDSDERGTLASFLHWLARAERQDDMGPRGEASEKGTVQLLTIHGSKGLEWDFVAIPGLTENSLPAKAREGAGWLRFGELPYPFRGDRSELPDLVWTDHESQKSYDLDFAAYKDELGARAQAEERRLIYVATTRAQRELLLTGSFWAGGSTVRRPSRYLDELVEAGLIGALPEGSADTVKPASDENGTELWPFDPLGARRGVVEAAAGLVRQAIDAGTDVPTDWSKSITLLLDERARGQADAQFTPLPMSIPASRFKDYVDDPAGVAARLRRPMPERPYRAARVGTLFHSWLERRAEGAGAPDAVDVGVLDRGEQEQLDRFKATFERSPWATLTPEEVEIEIHHVLAGQVFVCKLDAVYQTKTGYQVVDWKTGKAPRSAADLELKQTQLALYRLAYARWKGIDPERVDAVFYFVADDTIVAPDRLYTEEDLVSAWSSVAGSSNSPGSNPDRS